jgi:hypothetical protein
MNELTRLAIEAHELSPLKERKFAGWEGGLAPAQVSHPLNTELTAQAEGTFHNCQHRSQC